MASDSDDAAFFDKLVQDDDDISTLTLASYGFSGQLRAPELPPVASATTPAAAAGPEGVSPGSGKGAHTTFKQVQWSVFGGSGNGSESDPFGDFSVGGGGTGEEALLGGNTAGNQSLESSVVGSSVDRSFSTGMDQNATAQLELGGGAVDSSDPKYLESLYPGWKYDEATQQWYQVDSLSTTSKGDHSGAGGLAVAKSDNVQQQHSSVSYLQNSVQAGVETVAEEGSTTVGSISSWGQDGSSTAASEYPPNILFYIEYPGWYFDTNTQQWHPLESYQQATSQTITSVAVSDGFGGTDHSLAQIGDSFASGYNQQGQLQQDVFSNNMKPDSLGVNSFAGSSYGSNQHAADQIGQQVNAEPFESSTNHQPSINTFVPSTSQYSGIEGNQAGYKGFEPSTGHQKGFEPSKGHLSGYKGFEPSTGHQAGYNRFEPSTTHGYGDVNGAAKSQGFVPTRSKYHTKTHADASQQVLSNSYLGSDNSVNFAQQQFLGSNASSQQFGSHEERSSAGRPPHALVAFGFGGKLLVMKETSSMTTNFNSGNQGNFSGMVSILNISEIVADKVDHSSITNGSTLSYFRALCHQPIPGPLVGGSAAAKDVNKWLDEMITCYESSVSEFQGGNVQKLLISLLKILCQHYGKLRSPFGSDPSQEDLDGPEMAVTKLFSSSKSSAHMREFGSIVHCMKNIPSESQIQVTAQEVQMLLVSGRRKEALQCAQEGQLWGPALTLALQLGDKFYVDTVKKMAHCHFVSGSPLRTLCLLIAGQPADVFNVESPVDSNYSNLHTLQQPVESTPKGMLDGWEENLAIITANRTKGDELVITHLGDCLWKEKNEVAAAHSCYLVAELNVESYSESARLCLIGADHFKCPRTFASPEAIQMTEVYEYAKVLGNSQYILIPFQPYKLIYAYMLAEVGKVSDSLRYCQASLKVLKASGRASELETWKQLFSSLEEQIRTHQQGGYGTNLAPAKIVGKIFTSLDKSLSRMMGTPSTPLPQLLQGSVNNRDSYSAAAATKVVNSQSVMAMSSLMSSTSEQSMSDMAGNSGLGRTITPNRSISEPDFGRTPKQGSGSDTAQSTSGLGTSRFGWLSSTLQKTVGFVSKSHRQAKLGEQNKFYYDEKLKRWVEAGAEVPAEEPPLPPPPTKATFQNGMPDYNLNVPSGGDHTASGFAEVKPSNLSELSSGMPPIPPNQNQFSARGRIGVRSRYVDTFNKGSANAIGAATSYNKLASPSMKPLSGAKFFVPGPAVVSSEQMPASTAETFSKTTHHMEPSSPPPVEVLFSSPPPAVPMSSTLQRYPSMDNIITPSASVNTSFSRSRAASWSGIYSDQFSTTVGARSPDGQNTQSPLMPGRKPSHSRSSSNSSVPFSGLAEDLHDVDL